MTQTVSSQSGTLLDTAESKLTAQWAFFFTQAFSPQSDSTFVGMDKGRHAQDVRFYSFSPPRLCPDVALGLFTILGDKA